MSKSSTIDRITASGEMKGAGRASFEQPSRTAVIGGGLLGMQIAANLNPAGHAVTLFESAPHLGGLADAWTVGGITWDRHYHVILMSDLRTRKLLDELNLADQLIWAETKTGFYTDGTLYSMSNTPEFLRFPPLRLIDKLRLGGTIFYASKIKHWRRLERIPVVDWLRKWSGSRTTERVWLPLLRAKLGENYRDASAAFIWAIIARMYAARRTGLKKEQFGYVRGGYGRVLQAFADQLKARGVDIRTSCLVTRIQRTADPSLAVQTANGDSERFDRVVVTAPAPVIPRLCPDLAKPEIERLQGLRYQGIVCASVVLKKALSPYYVTNITDGWVPFTAVIEMTALVKPEEFGGKHLVYLPKYVDPTDPLFETPDEAIRESFLSALEKMYPHFHRDDVLAFQLSRVRNVLAISTLNYSEHVPPFETSVPGLSIATSAQIVNGTLNVNETLTLADRASEHLLCGVVK
ncbi:MAG: NAD(P)/FAD-dependent oxidoreductase [Gemmataceae bacterium]